MLREEGTLALGNDGKDPTRQYREIGVIVFLGERSVE